MLISYHYFCKLRGSAKSSKGIYFFHRKSQIGGGVNKLKWVVNFAKTGVYLPSYYYELEISFSDVPTNMQIRFTGSDSCTTGT